MKNKKRILKEDIKTLKMPVKFYASKFQFRKAAECESELKHLEEEYRKGN